MIGKELMLNLSLSGYITKRLLLMIIVVFGVVSLTFIISHVIPLDAAAIWAGEKTRMQELDMIIKKYHLDEPLWRQYIFYFQDLFKGDLGISPVSNRPVSEDLSWYFPATVELAIISLIIVMSIGIPLGVLAALNRGGRIDQFLRVITLAGSCMPVFWIAVMLQYVFYFILGWLPYGGRITVPYTRITGLVIIDTLITRNFDGFLNALIHMILPAFVLSFSSLGFITRITRSSMLEVLQTEYVRTAKAKGLPNNVVNFQHALRNALIPPITAISAVFAGLLQGAIITETVFSYPGVGQYIGSSIYTLDFPAIIGFTLIIGFVVSIVNFFTDIVYVRIDPRIKTLEG
jgi:peptide/nickel transport system permease protein